MPASIRWKRVTLLALLLCLIAVAGWWVTGQVRAWHHHRAGVRALAQDDPALARQHLKTSVRLWPTSGEAHFLLARAARRCGELGEASRHLEEAAHLGWVPAAIELERAMLMIQADEPGGAEAYLLDCLKREHPDSALIVEVLTPVYLRTFRMSQADYCVKLWVKLQPERALAWNNKAILAQRLRRTKDAIEAFREEVRLEPTRHKSRLELARLLIDQQQPAEAGEHLAVLAEAQPKDPEVAIELARLRDREGKRAEATRLLDKALEREPNHPQALHLRGRFALEGRDSKTAELYLRRAVRLDPLSCDLQYTWVRCLQAVKKTDEAQRAEQRLRRLEADLKQLDQLTATVVNKPFDPVPRREIAAIYIRNEMDEEGLRWLQTALRAAPTDALTHHALAEYYQRKGNHSLATLHRARSGQEVRAP